MKKTALCLAVLLLLALSLSSCLTPRVTYEPANGKDGIASVKIYYVESTNGYDAWKDAPDLDELASASVEIPADRHAKLLIDLENLKFEDFILLAPVPSDPNFYIYGYVLAITYEDGGYEYITPNGIQVWGENADDFDLSHLSCDNEEWQKFIDKYAPDLALSTSADESTTITEPSKILRRDPTAHFFCPSVDNCPPTVLY
ncbi:MAG: hypothetical protein IJD38_12345 [Clostridia bacterium]|nr:hypothetical protein [Clostridia bacterium]